MEQYVYKRRADDLSLYREPEDAEKEEQAVKEAVAAVVKPAEIPASIDTQDLDWTQQKPQTGLQKQL
nr:unnamed protein product [Callosobruchus chinensis]